MGDRLFSDPTSREKVEAAGAITRAIDLASGDFGDFRTSEHYRLRVLLHAGGVTWATTPITARIRTPRSLLKRVEPLNTKAHGLSTRRSYLSERNRG